MKFRLKAFGLHFLGSVCFLSVALGCLYFGWYRWPGWYLSSVLTIVLMMVGVDVVLGPLLTLVIANPKKPRRELTRDVGIIVLVQLVAGGYGVATLWNGRPLYYTYSERLLEMVQATDLDPGQVALGRKLNPDLAPYWYSLPRWIYAPLPEDAKLADSIVKSASSGGDDVIQMPRYYKPWEAGLADLRKNLRVVDKMAEFGLHDKQVAAERMRKMGIPFDQPVALPMKGRGKPLLALVDPTSAKIVALIRLDN